MILKRYAVDVAVYSMTRIATDWEWATHKTFFTRKGAIKEARKIFREGRGVRVWDLRKEEIIKPTKEE